MKGVCASVCVHVCTRMEFLWVYGWERAPVLACVIVCVCVCARACVSGRSSEGWGEEGRPPGALGSQAMSQQESLDPALAPRLWEPPSLSSWVFPLAYGHIPCSV